MMFLTPGFAQVPFRSIWLWVKNRVTPKWLALVNGNLDDLTCGPIPGGLILTHAHIRQTVAETKRA